jgi:hypothetical protein
VQAFYPCSELTGEAGAPWSVLAFTFKPHEFIICNWFKVKDAFFLCNRLIKGEMSLKSDHMEN